jgi:hypothetical protein
MGSVALGIRFAMSILITQPLHKNYTIIDNMHSLRQTSE